MNNESLEHWKQEISEIATDTFCILPWIHFTTRTNGDMRLCCVSNASGVDDNVFDSGFVKTESGIVANFSTNTLTNMWNSEYMRSVRRIMLNGEIPDSCIKCFNEEKLGIVSKRVWETLHWSTLLDINKLIENTDDGEIPNIIRYVDLRLGHTCNLKCVMCGPTDSSKWVADQKKLIPLIQDNPTIYKQVSWNEAEFNNSWFEDTEFWNELKTQIPNLIQLNFAGGEPLIIKEHREFIKEVIDMGYSSNIMLKYNTNGLLITDDIIELWSKFKKVQVGISLDAIQERNYYIRYPCDWDTIESTLDKLDNTEDNIEVTIACAIQVLNIKHLPDFIKWKVGKNYKKINNFKRQGVLIGGGLINVHLVYIPTYLDIRILPSYEKDNILEIFSELKQWLWDNYTTDDDFWNKNPYGWKRWEAILKFLISDDRSEHLKNFIDYIHSIDKIRNLNSSDYFPELLTILK